MSRCAVCHTLIEAGDAVEECPDCRHRYHAVCWRELGGCATFGCARAVAGEKAPVRTVAGGGWGDTKTCPNCLTTIGAIYITAVCLLPEFLAAEMGNGLLFGGTSILIVVSVTMDTVAQIQSQLLAHQYEGLIKKAKLRGRGGRGATAPVRR